jgi:hypothetical protein
VNLNKQQNEANKIISGIFHHHHIQFAGSG